MYGIFKIWNYIVPILKSEISNTDIEVNEFSKLHELPRLIVFMLQVSNNFVEV